MLVWSLPKVRNYDALLRVLMLLRRVQQRHALDGEHPLVQVAGVPVCAGGRPPYEHARKATAMQGVSEGIDGESKADQHGGRFSARKNNSIRTVTRRKTRTCPNVTNIQLNLAGRVRSVDHHELSARMARFHHALDGHENGSGRRDVVYERELHMRCGVERRRERGDDVVSRRQGHLQCQHHGYGASPLARVDDSVLACCTGGFVTIRWR